jgi:ankyrin repeat protein
MKLLLERGADPNAKCHSRDPVFQTVMRYLNVSNEPRDLVGRLLEAGANPNRNGSFGRTPIHQARRDGRAKLLRLLLQHGGNPNVRGHYQRTALHAAAEGNRFELARLLIRAGADPDAADEEGKKPIDLTDDAKLIDLL